MILYTNGDEITAGAYLVNDYAFANDDFSKVALGRKPHPDNLNASWGMHLSKLLKLSLVCDAESNCSNERILRTTYDFLHKKLPELDSKLTYVVIGWTSWEREEWYYEPTKEYFYVSQRGTDVVPSEWQKRYKQYLQAAKWEDKNKLWDKEIWELHHYLNNLEISHLFFNSSLPLDPGILQVRDWNWKYIDPYATSYRKFIHFQHYDRNDLEAQKDWATYLFSVLTNQSYP